MKLNIRRILFYLWPHVRKHWLSFSLVFVGYAVGIVFDQIAKPYIYKEFVDLFTSGLNREVIFHQATNLGLILCGVVVIYNIGYRTGDYATAYMQSKVMKKLHDFSFNRLLLHSYNFFTNNFSGSLIAKSKRFSRSFETFFDIISFQVFFSIITLGGILTVLFIKAPEIAYIFLGWSVIYLLVTFLFIKKKIKYDILEAEADSEVTAKLSDAIMNILNIKIFSSAKQEKEAFDEVTTDEENKRRKSWYFANFQNTAQALLMAVLNITVIFTSIRMWYAGTLSVGMIVLLQAYMFNLFDILWNLGRSLTRMVKSLTDMKEIVDIFDLPLEIRDPTQPKILNIKKGDIKFQNVDFYYKLNRKVVDNLTLEIKPGEHIGLVGHSGAGKSTVTKLLLRFMDITSGEILIDGQNIKDLTQDDLRSVISYVPQEPILFHRSIKENIAYSKPNATDKEIMEVAKKAHAHEFITKLSKGYDTLVGERGVKLSGGERQRIAIARAMLKDAPILVLDEATSSLDSVSESYIQEAFVELMKNKTTLVIAHRLSTIQKMDRIIVMEKGKIMESGTHMDLLEKKGIYAELWSHQSGGFIAE